MDLTKNISILISIFFKLFSSEYGITKCFHAGGIYVFTQLCKMLILTFFPETINANPDGFNFLGVKCWFSYISMRFSWPLIILGMSPMLCWSSRLCRFNFRTQQDTREKPLKITHSSSRMGVGRNRPIEWAHTVEGSWSWVLVDLYTKISGI